MKKFVMNYGNRRFLYLCAIFIVLFVSESFAENPALQQLLDERFAGFNGAIQIIDARSGEGVAGIRPEMLKANYPPGSLIKLFTAIAYYRQHGASFPEFYCPRSSAHDPEGCWDRKGHGTAGIEKALAFSCNVYFRKLSETISFPYFTETLRAYELFEAAPDVSEWQTVMTGKSHTLTMRPERILMAYARIFSSRELPPDLLRSLQNGLKLGGEIGTSTAARKYCPIPFFGKTGTTLRITAKGTDWRHTQGWWIGLFPAANPEIAVLIFTPEGRGATHAAPAGGKTLALYMQVSGRN